MLNGKRIGLLEKIGVTGSISQAAKNVRLTYKGACDPVEDMNGMFGEALVASTTDGKRGGDTELTVTGIKVVETFKVLAKEHQKFLETAY